MQGVGPIFRALADPTRRQILQDLKDGELGAGEIAQRFEMTAPSISRHLAILGAAGLVESRRQGNRIIYRLLPETLAGAFNDVLSAVCPTQILRRSRRPRRKEPR